MVSTRIAFSTLACPDWTLSDALDAAGRLGYDGLELRLLDGKLIDPVEHSAAVKQAVSQSRALGIEVCAFDTSCRLAVAEPAERAAVQEELRAWISLANDCAVTVLRVFGGADPGDADGGGAASDARLADALGRILPEAAQAHVALALETHDAYSSARRVAHVLDLCPSPFAGALWDSHHPYRMGESPADVLAALGARILHVHVKDARRLSSGDSEWQLVPLGDGDLPVLEQLSTLSRSGYQGWISVEWEKIWHPEIAPPEVALPQHITWLRHALAAIALREAGGGTAPVAEGDA